MELDAACWMTTVLLLSVIIIMKTALSEDEADKDDSYRTDAHNHRSSWSDTTATWWNQTEAIGDVRRPKEDFKDSLVSARLQRSELLLSRLRVCKPYLYCAPRRCPPLDQTVGQNETESGLEEIDFIGWQEPETTPAPGMNQTGSFNKNSECQGRELVGVVCSCDGDCVRYGDCCIDAFISCFQLSTLEDILEFIVNATRVNASRHGDGYDAPLVGQADDWMLTDFVTCEVVSKRPEVNVLMVSTCPACARHSGECENQTKFLPPVTLVGSKQWITFKNVHCALCHGAEVSKLLPWSVKFVCGDRLLNFGGSLFENANSDNCSKEFVPPAGVCTPRFCRSETKLATAQLATMARSVREGICTWQDEVLCKSYFFPVSETANNPHCEACLEQGARKRRSADVHSSITCQVLVHELILSGGIHVILDLFGRYASQFADVSDALCADDQVFDNVGSRCLRLKCPFGQKAYRGACKPQEIEQLVSGSSQIFPDKWDLFLIKFEIIGALDVSLMNVTQWAWLRNVCLRHSANVSCLAEGTGRASQNEGSAVTQRGVVACDGGSEKLDYFSDSSTTTPSGLSDQCADGTERNETTPIEFTLQLSETEELNILQALDDITRALLESVGEHRVSSVCLTNAISSHTTACPDGTRAATLRHASIRTKDASVFARVNTTRSVLLFPFQHIGFELWPHPADFVFREGAPVEKIFVCETDESLFRENCTVVSYGVNETVYNGTHVKVPSGEYLSQGSFLITGDEVLVCTGFKFATSARPRLLVDQMFLMLSTCVTGLSCLLLLAMVTAYCAFPELRTLPGKLIASLALTMMLTFAGLATTALVDMRHEIVCPAFAVFNHLVALAHFGWMSAVAVNMALNFGAAFPVEPFSSGCTFLKYFLSVWGAAALFVVVPVILQVGRHSEPAGHSSTPGLADDNFPRYGHPICGWFSGPMWTRLAFVIAPYLLSLAISVGGFVFTMVGLRRAMKASRRLNKQRSRRLNCVIILKLSTAMGFFWPLSLVQSALGDDDDSSSAISYLTLVTVLMQGALLFIAFMVNTRVYDLAARAFCVGWGHVTETKTHISTVLSKSETSSKPLKS